MENKTSNEGDVKKQIKKLLEHYGIYPFEKALASARSDIPISGYYMMPASSGFGEAGMADFLCNIEGIYVEIEAKDKAKQSGIQRAHQEVIEATGGLYYLQRGFDLSGLEDLLEDLLEIY